MKRISAKVMWAGRATMFLVGLAATLALALAVDAKPAHAYEVHISITGAGQVTETTSANLVGSGCVTSPTNPTGTVGVNCYPGDPDGPYVYGWDVDYVAIPKPGYRFVAWMGDGSGPNAVICDRSNPPATTNIHYGDICKFRTFENLQTRVIFVDDTNPSMASLAGPNQTVSGPATFTFSAVADSTFRHFECRVAGIHDWQTCSSGHTENPPTGTYTLQVRAVDWSDNRSGELAWTWTVDKIAPETSLINGPSGSVAGTSATFEFTSNESGTFICSLDGVETSCGSPKPYAGLPQGQHTFRVWARDVAGNRDPTPAQRSWTVDTIPPGGSMSINDGAAHTRSAAVDITLSASDSTPGSGVTSMRFSNDGVTWSEWEPYATDKSWTLGSGDGEKTVRAQYRDGANNTVTAQDAIQLDTTPPETNITSGSSGTVKTTTASFAFSSEAGATFECRLDGGEFEACASPMSYSGLSNGSHTFSVRAKDAAGNVDDSPASRAWRVDTIAPRGSVKINNGAKSTKSLRVRLNLSATDSTSGVSRMCVSNTPRCSAWQPLARGKAWRLSGNKAGVKAVYVKYQDRAGNASAVFKDTIRYAPKKRR